MAPARRSADRFHSQNFGRDRSEAGSFQAATDRLGITQLALSTNMSFPGAGIGATVFTREGRRSAPSKLGFWLAISGMAIRIAEEQAELVAEQPAARSTGELRISAPPVASGRFLTKALARFIKKNPNCKIEFRASLLNELRSMLECGQNNLVIGPQSLADPADGLEFDPIIDDRAGILARVSHPLS